ncbi:uncharacterized protein EAE97_011527 [Botrytis byssoidea]|uniref:Uncharacterized protein n=1 Tax=Botrytis byssoidea TaxID=139641 RepID=A0A9P5HWF3_9HELO|nr:uncharacterized protein EAE97_011527 [Botrytis byssoidea]KAF7920186.1 hypothetical protein EAE97_011527 [Botrytis byssoidea]
MKSQNIHKDEAHIPMRFRILIYALERGITQAAFVQAYSEILSNVEETEYDLSPEMRQSMVERQVWMELFPDETSPPPLEFPVAEGYFDPPVSRKAVEQYRIWQISYLDSQQNQQNNSEPQYNKMQQNGRHAKSSSDISISPVIQYDTRVDPGTEIMMNNSTRLSDHIAPTSDEDLRPDLPQRARTYEEAMHNSDIISIGDPAVDDLTIILRVDEGGASMLNQSIRPSRSTSSMVGHFNQQLNIQQPETPESEADLSNGEMVQV